MAKTFSPHKHVETFAPLLRNALRSSKASVALASASPSKSTELAPSLRAPRRGPAQLPGAPGEDAAPLGAGARDGWGGAGSLVSQFGSLGTVGSVRQIAHSSCMARNKHIHIIVIVILVKVLNNLLLFLPFQIINSNEGPAFQTNVLKVNQCLTQNTFTVFFVVVVVLVLCDGPKLGLAKWPFCRHKIVHLSMSRVVSAK